MVQSEARFERQSARNRETVLGIPAERGAGLVARDWRVDGRRFGELIVNGVEAEHEHVISDGADVGDVRVRVKLSALETVIRNFYFAIKKREALFRHETAAIDE